MAETMASYLAGGRVAETVELMAATREDETAGMKAASLVETTAAESAASLEDWMVERTVSWSAELPVAAMADVKVEMSAKR